MTFDRLCVFVFVSFLSFFCESIHYEKQKKKKKKKKKNIKITIYMIYKPVEQIIVSKYFRFIT